MTWLRVVLLVAALTALAIAAWTGSARIGWLGLTLATGAFALPVLASI